jgi:endo-1,4-beta-mannosidase
MPIGDPFMLGVNYWPRRKAMYWWSRFDAAEVHEEFAMIRELGLGFVRLFLMWENFQPRPDTIDKTALGNLRRVCDIASDLELALQPTFFTGHMSGPNWAPDWLISDEPRTPKDRALYGINRSTPSPRRSFNTFAEPFVIEAQKLKLRTICGELKDHPAIWAWSLGNEPDLYCWPPDAATGRKWVGEMVRTIKSVDPDHPVLIGLHTESIDRDCGLRVDDIAAETDLSVMHGYSIYNPLARQAIDYDYVPFTCSLVQALAGRPVLYEEFGICTREVDAPSGYEMVRWWDGRERRQWFSSDEDAAEYYRQVLPRLGRVGALGGFAWCFADYDRSLWDLPPCNYWVHERFFGLYRADGSLKPMGQAVKDFALSHPRVGPNQRPVALDVSADEYYANPQPHLKRLYEQFGTLAQVDNRHP